ncbi:DUF3293 domain-containing protein [Dyella sp. ASV21]|uniref:DUF3293 domain-containing protein n=1 Tax=Dyella sp. ASV21 TaxID=2795114 RepID=UPI0018EB6AF8|nr:DUF3293 domain-containing protein [Dyella sp. ASV21]
MDEALLAAYRTTEYRVRRQVGGWHCLRIDQPLPPALSVEIGAQPWGFITAWNPRSQPLPLAQNRAAQRHLLCLLRERPDAHIIHAGLGIARNASWREPSLFIVGLEITALDTLAQRFGQHAYVHGRGAEPARLRWTPAC